MHGYMNVEVSFHLIKTVSLKLTSMDELEMVVLNYRNYVMVVVIFKLKLGQT